MKKIAHFFALSLLVLCAALYSCSKTEELEPVTPDTTATSDERLSVTPEGARIIIRFGTSTQLGCMYSFSNCIYIGWGALATAREGAYALQFDKGEAANDYFGHYFPLTGDYKLDAASAKSLGLREQVIPAGIYPIEDSPAGKIVRFGPESRHYRVKGLVNPVNPQDNIGQLHNFAVQTVLSGEHRARLARLKGDKTAVRSYLAEQTALILKDAGLDVNKADMKAALSLQLDRNYGDYAARLNDMRLSDKDKKTLAPVFEKAASLPVGSLEELNRFMTAMTDMENAIAQGAATDNPRMVLSLISVLKYSRYYWFWKSMSQTAPGAADQPQQGVRIPEWVWADVIAFELGGPLASAVASAIVYLDTH